MRTSFGIHRLINRQNIVTNRQIRVVGARIGLLGIIFPNQTSSHSVRFSLLMTAFRGRNQRFIKKCTLLWTIAGYRPKCEVSSKVSQNNVKCPHKSGHGKSPNPNSWTSALSLCGTDRQYLPSGADLHSSDVRPRRDHPRNGSYLGAAGGGCAVPAGRRAVFSHSSKAQNSAVLPPQEERPLLYINASWFPLSILLPSRITISMPGDRRRAVTRPVLGQRQPSIGGKICVTNARIWT